MSENPKLLLPRKWYCTVCYGHSNWIANRKGCCTI